MKNVLFGLIALFAFVAYGGADAPASADNSVLVNKETVTQAATTTVVADVVANDCNACDSLRGVRLSPWHLRRLNRIADRQEARDCRDCCKCNCKPAPSAFVERNRCKCNCN